MYFREAQLLLPLTKLQVYQWHATFSDPSWARKNLTYLKTNCHPKIGECIWILPYNLMKVHFCYNKWASSFNLINGLLPFGSSGERVNLMAAVVWIVSGIWFYLALICWTGVINQTMPYLTVRSNQIIVTNAIVNPIVVPWNFYQAREWVCLHLL